MEFLSSQITQFLADLLLPFIRLSSMLMVLAGIGGKTTPARIKILLALFITLAVLPVLPPARDIELGSMAVVLYVLQQILIGVAMGFVSMLLLSSFTLAGQVLAIQTGLGFSSVVDPVNGLNVAAVGQFYLMLATLFFWLFDGHLLFIQAIVFSFEAFPIDGSWWPAANFRLLAEWGGWMFAMALSLALAPLTAMLLINFSFGVMTRAAPQLNIFSIGFPITMTSGMIIIWLTISNVLLHFEQQYARMQQLLCQLTGC